MKEWKNQTLPVKIVEEEQEKNEETRSDKMSQFIMCPSCKAEFVTSHDFNQHLETHWRTTRKGDGETIPRHVNPLLNARLMKAGWFIEHGYRYALLGDVIYRTSVATKY